jgi:2-oxoglutarate dehydrogenase complex, dehydrogenase (E1) component, and related enzymes
MHNLLPNEKIKLVSDDKIRRVIMCSGKVYYDLYDEREKRGIDDIYILRVEQLYPFPTKALSHRTVALQAGGNGLVSGGAAQYGRLVLRRYFPAMDSQSDQRQTSDDALCGASCLGFYGSWPDVEASRATQAIP